MSRSLPTTHWIQNHKFQLKLNDVLDVELFLEELNKRVYTQVPCVEEVGEYAVRGGIVDFWTPGEKYPSRIEFFDDLVEKITVVAGDQDGSIVALQEFFKPFD